MNKKNKLGFVKKLAVGVLAVGMIIAGIVVVPKQAAAEDVVMIRNTVTYVKYNDAADYWKQEPKAAPVMDGYVFGGWFTEVTTKTERTETYKTGDTEMYYDPLTTVSGAAYAKFVPAQVLSVKAQNGVDKNLTLEEIDATTVTQINKENPMWVRVMTGQDSENYSAIGFDIRLANVKAPKDSADGDYILETDKVFNKVYVGETLTAANDIFGDSAEFVCVWKLDKIDTPSNADKIIYVRPYWYTMDGTKVLGLAKYVHIEDEYLNYINVPINLQSAKDIAAGTVSMSYDYTGLEPISNDEKEYFEAGRILPEMDVNHNAMDKTFSMVGNAANQDQYNSEETIYANIRFKKPTTDVNFNMTLGEFCNWGEQIVENANVKVWDIAYDVKTTTNQ